MENKKSKLISYLTAAALTTSSMGCSTMTETHKKDNFPIGTEVYSLPRSYADSTGIESYSNSTLREIVGNKGTNGVYDTDTFLVEETLAERLDLKGKFGDVGFNTKITNERFGDGIQGLDKYQPIKDNQRMTFEEQEQVKKTHHFYDEGIYANPLVRGLVGIVVIGGISYLGYKFLNKDNDKSEEKEKPAPTEVSGGREDPISDFGSIRGGRTNDDQSGSTR